MNWSISKPWCYISWYNIKNEDENDYCKKYNQAYQENKDTYFKKIFHFKFRNPKDSDREWGLEYVNEWNSTHFVWVTPNNLYWFFLKDSPRYDRKATWNIRFSKNSNDHVGCM